MTHVWQQLQNGRHTSMASI